MLPDPILLLSPALIAVSAVWILAVLLIVIDIYRLRRLRVSGKPVLWYASPLLWFASCGFPLGLILASFYSFPHLSPLLWPSCLLLLLLLTGGLIAVVRWDLQAVARKDEERVRQLAETHPRMVAISKLTVVPVEAMLITMGFLIVSFAITILLKPYFSIIPLLLMLLLALMGIIISSRYSNRFIRRINQQKAALTAENAARGPSQELSQEPEQVVFSPLTMRFKGSALAGYLILTGVFCSIWFYSLNAGSSSSIVSLLFPICYTPLIIFHLLRSVSERIETTTRGLTVTRGIWFAQQKLHIPWQSVRLFTCYPVYGFWKSRTRLVYELSGPGRAIQWTRLAGPRSFWSLWRPVLATDEYNQRHEDLCAFISKQTGLSLHDLNAPDQPAREEMVMTQSQEKRG